MISLLNAYGPQIATFIMALAALINSFSTRKERAAQVYLKAIESRVALLEVEKREAVEERDDLLKRNELLESQNIALMKKILNVATTNAV